MKKILLALTSITIFGTNVFSQNVGIGTNNPQTKLQVEGSISSTPASAAAAATVTIPANTSIFRLTFTSGSQANALSIAASAEGQYLSIYNTDDDAATFAGQTIAATNGVASFNYINGGWRTVSNTKAAGDLSGTYPNPTVAKIQGRTVSSATPSNGDVLKYNTSTSQYEPAPDLNSGGTVGSVTASPPLSSSGGATPNISLTGTVPVGNGGTGLTAIGAGQILIGTSSNTFLNTTLTGTPNQVNITSASGSVTLSTPQDIATTSSPTFTKITATGANINSVDATGSIKPGTTTATAATAGAGAIRTNGTNVEYSDGTTWKTVAAAGNYVDLTTNQTAAGNKTWSGTGSFTGAGTGLSVTNSGSFGSSVVVGPKGSFFGSDQGGNIELGTDNGTANTVGAVPYIDFHYGTGTIQDFNTRLQNDANGQLSIIGNARVSSLTTAGIVTNNASGVLSTTTSIPVGNLPDATTSTKGIVQLAGDLAGTAASPQIAAGAIVDADINGSANIADTKLATISTAGKVSNSATTATSANTPNAIVARDGSGNFSAGTITATLNGNATSATNIAGGSAGKVPYQTAAGTTTFTATSPAAAGVYMRSSGANTWDATAIQVGDLPASVSGAWTRSAPNVSLVTSTDKVGIGTSTPGAKLQVYEPTALGATAGNSQILSRFSGDVGNHFMNNTWLYRDASSPTSWQTARLHDGISVDASFLTPGSDTRVWWERDPNDNIQSWGNANATYLTINAGNIGIGTTAPLQKLEVNTGGIGFSGSGLNSADKKLYSPADGDLEWMTHTGAGVHGFAISHQGAKAVYLNISGNSYLNGGNVGIGTASPGYKLEVVGTGRFGNAANAYVYTASGATTGAGGIEIFGSGNVGYIRFHDPGVAWRDLALNDAGGNVGIGTATPAYKLDVNGNFRTTGQALVQGGLLTQGTASTLYGTNASIYANNANVTGGGLMISDDGGFFDYNDGPVTFNGSTGLRIAGTSGAASSNGYLRVNQLGGTGNRDVYADANGILRAGSNRKIAYVEDRTQRSFSNASGGGSGAVNISNSTGNLAVEVGDIISINSSFKFAFTGGSGNDDMFTILNITGCATTSQQDAYYQQNWDNDRNEMQPISLQWVYVSPCSGNLQFNLRINAEANADDGYTTSEVVLVATKY